MTDKCSIELLAAVGRDQVQKELIDRIEEEAGKLSRSDPTQPMGIHYATAAERVAAEMKGEASNYRQQLLTQVRAREHLTALLDGFIATGSKPEAAFRQTIGSVGDSSIASAERAKGRFVTDIEREELLADFYLVSKDDKLAEQLMTELQQLNMKQGKPGITKNTKAARMAKLFQEHVDYYRSQLKEAGFKVSTLEGRMLKQVWDTDRMLQAVKSGKEFSDILYPRLDRIGDRPIGDFSEADAKKLLEEFYEIKVGKQIDPNELKVSSRNMVLERQTYAVRQAQSRELHFKTPADSLFVLKTFGSGDVSSLMAETIRDLGKQVDLTFNMGVNPRANLFYTVAQAVNRGGSKQSIERGGWTLAQTPENLMNTIDGFYDNNSANPTISEASDTLHNFARASLLSFASISALGDFPTMNAANRRLGIERASSLVGAITRVFDSLPKEVVREAAGIVEMQSVHALGTAHRYITLPGMNHKLYNASVWAVDNMFKLNGLTKLTRKNKQTEFIGYSNLLAKQVSERLAYDDLPNFDKRTLLRGGMDKKDWEQLLAAKDAVFSDGDMRLMNTGALSPRLAAKVNAALSAFVNDAVITPNVQSRTMMSLGTQRGTPVNALVSQMSFLLGYPIAFVSQGIGRQIEARGVVSSSTMWYVAALTFMGVVTVVAKDYLKGKDRDYSSPEIMLQVMQEGMIAGGGMTIYGEHLWKMAGADRGVHHLFFGDSSQYRVPPNRPFEFKDILVGAGLEYAGKIAKGAKDTTWGLLTGDVSAAAASIAKTAQGTLPFVNLPVVKPILDATLFDYFIEMADPQAMEKAERRWNARTGGDFLLTDFEP